MPPKPKCLCGECVTCYNRDWARRNREKHNLYVRENYASVSETKAQWRARNRERINEAALSYKQPKRVYKAGDPKVLAQKKAAYAMRKGKLIPQPCEVCGAFPILRDGRRGVHGHHDDYSKPLEVRWLCNVHHGEAHRLMNVEAHRDIDEIPFS